MKSTYVIIAIAIIAVLGLWYFLEVSEDENILSDDNTVNTEETTSEDTQQNDTGTNTETVQVMNSVMLSPVETGRKANIAAATLTEPGYIVIYQVDSNSESEVIGASDFLEAGTYTNLEIDLDQIVALNQTVVAVLHEDDGDEVFEFPGSDGYLSTNAQPIVTDVDVVDVDFEDEDEELDEQVEVYLQNNAE